MNIIVEVSVIAYLDIFLDSGIHANIRAKTELQTVRPRNKNNNNKKYGNFEQLKTLNYLAALQRNLQDQRSISLRNFVLHAVNQCHHN